MTTAPDLDHDTAVRVLALRIAADLTENPPPAEVREEFELRHLVFYTADDQEHYDLDLFDDATLDAITAQVRNLIEAQ
jgi:hypothetical protein